MLVVVGLIALPLAVEDSFEPEPNSAPSRASPAAPHAANVSPDAIEAVNAVLAPGTSGPKPDAIAMAARIGTLGSDAIPVVVGMLCGSIPKPEFAHGTTDKPIHPGALTCREQVLFASLRRFNAKDVVSFLRDNAPFATLDEQLVFARLLGEVSNLDSQAALLELLAGIEPVQLQRDYVKSTLEEALARCVGREPGSLPALSRALPKLDPALLQVLARAVGRTHGPASAMFLARLLDKSAELDFVVLQELARVSESSGIALPDDSLGKVRRLLDHQDTKVVRAAITVLGRLCDRESFGVLAGYLEDSDRLVAAAAHWSLRSMARVDLGESSGAWITWLSEQGAWWEDQAPTLLENLRSSDASKVFAALSELNRHPFYKHDAARAIGPLVSDAKAALAISAISALERIGSTQACEWLVQALVIEDERKPAARKALKTLTGLDLPADYLQWSRALTDAP